MVFNYVLQLNETVEDITPEDILLIKQMIQNIKPSKYLKHKMTEHIHPPHDQPITQLLY